MEEQELGFWKYLPVGGLVPNANLSFSSVEECQLDENNMLIPIIVGAALAGLVLIVLIAYLSGRRRSHAGYQTI